MHPVEKSGIEIVGIEPMARSRWCCWNTARTSTIASMSSSGTAGNFTRNFHAALIFQPHQKASLRGPSKQLPG